MTHPKVKHYLDLAATATNLDDMRWYAQRAQQYVSTEQMIASCAKDGKVRVEESGRDCDCVEYWGRIHTIDATVDAFDALHDEVSEWADGPFELRIMPFETQVEYGSSDLALEAYENGHRHVIIGSRFP